MMDPKKAREHENSLQPERGASLVNKTGMAYLAEGMACANTQRRETSVPWGDGGGQVAVAEQKCAGSWRQEIDLWRWAGSRS